MIQANFQGLGPPPRSYISRLLKRRIVTAQAGALAAMDWLLLRVVVVISILLLACGAHR